MIGLGVKINLVIPKTGTSLAKIKQLPGKLSEPGNFLQKTLGRHMVQVLKRHFNTLDNDYPNKLNGRRQHFWRAVGKTVQLPTVHNPQEQTVSINHAVIAHKVGVGAAGGWIRPKAKQWLAWAVVPDAYGMTPRIYEQETGRKLFFLKVSDTTALLIERMITEYSKKEKLAHKWHKGNPTPHYKAGFIGPKQKTRVVFLCKKEVHQNPDPRALPPTKELELDMAMEAEKLLKIYFMAPNSDTTPSGEQP